MFERLRSVVLGVLRVPPEPHPPAGRPDSVRIFRAAPNYYRLRLAVWAAGQTLALAGILFWIGVLSVGRSKWQEQRAQAAHASPPAAAQPADDAMTNRAAGGETDRPAVEKRDRRRKARNQEPFSAKAARLADRLPAWAVPAVFTLEALGIVFFFAQAFVSYTVLRLDYDQRWYMVTDRSLRIRSGVWSVWEMTMSFANLQQVVVTQGPLQRWLGLADLRVESAGGGGSQQTQQGGTRSLHLGIFHGVSNAAEIRDLILERLREYRATGLGDPDESPAPTALVPGSVSTPAALAAARDVLAAARELRSALETSGDGS